MSTDIKSVRRLPDMIISFLSLARAEERKEHREETWSPLGYWPERPVTERHTLPINV